MRQYTLFLLIAIDQLINVLCGGYPDETMSARAWRGEQDGKLMGKFFRPKIDWLFSPWGPDHCKQSHESEITRSQFPSTYSNKP